MHTYFFHKRMSMFLKKSTGWYDEKTERDFDHCSWMDLYQDFGQ